LRTMFLLQYDINGTEIWARRLTTTTPSFGYGLSADEAGFVYVAGEVQGDFNFASVGHTAYGPVLLKYDQSGNEIWSVKGTNDNSYSGGAYNVAADGTNVYLSGTFGATTSFGSLFLTSKGEGDVFIAKYSNIGGNPIWLTSAGGDGEDRTFGLELDASGNIVTSGYFFGTSLDLFGFAVWNNTSPGEADIFIAKLDPNASLLWGSTSGTPGDDQAFAIAVDGNNVYQTGFTSVLPGSLGESFKQNGSYFLLAYDDFGNTSWVDIGEGYAWGRGLDFANGALYVAGNFVYSFKTSNNPVYSDSESRDIFIGKVTNFSDDGEGPFVSFNSKPDTYQLGTGGATIEISVTDQSTVETVVVAIAPISQVTDDTDVNEYTLWTPNQISPGVYSMDLQDSDFDGIGVQFFVAATDIHGNIGGSDPFLNYTYIVFGDFDRSLGDVVFPVTDDNNPQVSDYHMFAVPVTDQTISTVFNIGPDANSMAVFHYSNGTTNEFTFDANLDVGKGYWIIYLRGSGVDPAYGGIVINVNNQNPFIMQLNSGWNQIGNPFPFQIDWGAVLSYNEFLGNIPANGVKGIFTYNNGFVDRGNGTLLEHEGAFIESNEGYEIVIPLPGASSPFAKINARKGNKPLDAEDWKVNIDIENKITAYRVASVGMNPDAKIGLDDFDITPLPYLKDYIEFNAITEDDHEVISQSYVPTENGYVWDFEAKTSLEVMSTKLSWDNSTFGENNRNLMLYDIVADRVINMREFNEYKFTLDKKRPFKIVYGDEDFIKSHLVSAEVSVGKAYPNPFKQSVTIPFTLSESRTGYLVRAEVFNSMGQKVKTILNEPMTQGFYSLEWDGTNNSGQKLSEGIYFYRFHVETNDIVQNFTGKIIYWK